MRVLGTIDLRADDGRVLHSILAHPKRVGLLLFLCLEGPDRPHQRSRLLSLFWAESDEEHARTSLRKELHYLRQSFEVDAIENVGVDELVLCPGVLSCDVERFRAARAAGDPERAMSLYAGELCPGFYVPGAIEFERWLDRERQRLAREASDAAEGLSLAAESRGDLPGAVEWATRGLEISGDERSLRHLLEVLDRGGDRVEAMRVFESYFARLSADDGVRPSAETLALVEDIRNRSAIRAPPDPLPAMASTGSRTAAAAPDPRPIAAARTAPRAPPSASAPAQVRRVLSLRLAATIVVAAVSIAAIAGLGLGRMSGPGRSAREGPVLLVGDVRDYSGDSVSLAAALTDMLSTNLARIPALHVLNAGRVYEILATTSIPVEEAGAFARAGRLAGATQIVEGALYRTGEGALRLDLRRSALSSGRVEGAYSGVGRDLFELVDEATRRLAGELGAAIDPPPLTEVTTRSLTAYRLYSDGRRTFYLRGDPVAARDLFARALDEDSTFAMAAYAYWQAQATLDAPDQDAMADRSMRLAPGASEPERLFLTASWLWAYDEPALLAVAETLAVRYPNRPEGHYWVGTARSKGGDFLGAVGPFREAIARDSTILGGIVCTPCLAYERLVEAYLQADSADAAERVAREFQRLGPRVPMAHLTLARVLEKQGRFAEARTTFEVASRISEDPRAVGPRELASVEMRSGDFRRAAELVGLSGPDGDPSIGDGAPVDRWAWNIALRYQGRLREAALEPPGNFLQAQVLFESGRPRAAAAIFDTIARAQPWDTNHAGKQARHTAWWLTHVATSLAAAGDTTRLERLADSVEVVGARSGLGRDPKLHHHIRGLLWLARGDTARAETAFRAAIFSPTFGYTRTNLELGKLYLARDRPRDAIEILRPALRGALDASNLYVTHTEIHALLARAFDAASEGDSAVAHARWVAGALERADPDGPFWSLREEARARLARQDAGRR